MAADLIGKAAGSYPWRAPRTGPHEGALSWLETARAELDLAEQQMFLEWGVPTAYRRGPRLAGAARRRGMRENAFLVALVLAASAGTGFLERTVSNGDPTSPWVPMALLMAMIVVHLSIYAAMVRLRRGPAAILTVPVTLKARRRLGLYPARAHRWMVVLPVLLVLLGAAIAAWRLPGLLPPLIAGVVLYLTFAWELVPMAVRLWRAGPRDLVLITRYETTLLLHGK